MEHIEIIKQLSDKLSVPEVYTNLVEQLEKLDRPNCCVGILGQSNTGKTSMINILADLNIPVSLLPSQTNYKVEFGDKASVLPTPLGVIDISHPTAIKEETLTSVSEWLRVYNASIFEKQINISPETASVRDTMNFLCDFDVCIYLLDAQAAYTRTDDILLNHLSDAGIPVLAVIGKIEHLAEDDRAEVYTYVSKNISKYKNIALFSNDSFRPLQECKEELLAALKQLLAHIDVNVPRGVFANLYAANAVAQLFEQCETKIAECKAKQEDVENRFEKKLQQLEQASLSWIEVETQLKNRNNEMNTKVRAAFLEKKDDIVRRLTHDADMTGDIKTFWEKDIPFRLEEYMRSVVQSVNQMANKEMYSNVNWLQGELYKRFHCKLSIQSTLIRDGGKPRAVTSPDDLEITDTGKLRIITRIGTAATVITAGVLFATLSVSGIAMATSMLAGVGSEWLIKKKSNESRAMLKQYLPTLVDKLQITMLEDFNLRLNEAHNNIISQMNLLQAEWSSDERKRLEQEKRIALYNCSSTRWMECRDGINQVATLLIK
ncbi:MAG: hypothetical protein IJ786_03635 [Bacteroidaceae bacterium]|nr:hypothetical protein [Bacteroidaceae bacterium]